MANYRIALDCLSKSRLQVLPTSLGLLVTAADLSRKYGLLSGDALVVAVMHANGLSHLASNDADFDRVAGITRYAPA